MESFYKKTKKIAVMFKVKIMNLSKCEKHKCTTQRIRAYDAKSNNIKNDLV